MLLSIADSNYWLYMVATSAMSTLISYLIYVAIRWAGPIVVTMVHRTDVVMVALIDMIFYNLYPNLLSVIGIVLVVLSSIGLTLANVIERFICLRIEKIKPRNQSETSSTNSACSEA